MDTNDILRLIREEFEETQINEILLAAMHGFERVHPQGELLYIALPKEDQKERKRIMDSVNMRVMGR